MTISQLTTLLNRAQWELGDVEVVNVDLAWSNGKNLVLADSSQKKVAAKWLFEPEDDDDE